MAVLDGGGSGPTLNPKAKHYERRLFKVFSSSTASIWLTQNDWRAAKTQLEDLAKDVRQVHTELQAPPTGGRGWQGPAAEAALASLQKLSSTLDTHATKVGDVDTSLGQVHTAITEAKAGWYSEVASISTYVDPAEHTRLPAPYLPTPENRAQYSVPDTEAAAAAEDALWEQRNQAAKRVLDRLGTDTQTATSTMPIETRTRSETPYSQSGPGGGGGDYPAGTRTPSTSGGYAVQPDTGVVFDGDRGDDEDRDRPDPVVIIENPDPETDPDPELDPDPETEPDRETGVGPETGVDPETGLDPISSDGDVTGTIGTNPTGDGVTSPGMQAPRGGGGIGAGGLAAGGLGAGAAGVGGILGARGGMARGGAIGVGSSGGTRGGTTVRPGGAGARGGAAFGSAGSARGGATVVPGGGGAAGQSRAGASGRGSAVKGASGSGRYGVPKLDGRGGGAAPTASGQSGRTAGGRAGRSGPVGAAGAGGGRTGEKRTAADVDGLTHEDEDTWYDGTDESSPQVWD
ncbi:WXG100 family type VII secretion target [Knoellia sp. CPCC 206435]|uniref:WXG100 family type VII secretion target n=1 Tax=Knoellia terrae TaxID=3404797 RepID=UPI003B43C62C